MGSSSLPHRGQSFHLSQSGAFLPDILLVVLSVPTYLHDGIVAIDKAQTRDHSVVTMEVLSRYTLARLSVSFGRPSVNSNQSLTYHRNVGSLNRSRGFRQCMGKTGWVPSKELIVICRETCSAHHVVQPKLSTIKHSVTENPHI